MSAALNLYGELIGFNPRMPVNGADSWPIWPACPDSHLTEAQRALFGVFLIDEYVPRWEWLSHLLSKRPHLPLIVWAGRTVKIGKTGEFIEQLVRMSGGDPDVLAAGYAKNPDTADTLITWKSRRIDRIDFESDHIQYESILWWLSDAGHADFNQRVFDFALQRLPELIALDED